MNPQWEPWIPVTTARRCRHLFIRTHTRHRWCLWCGCDEPAGQKVAP